MTNLFIDTNVFLNFFSFSNDHLNKLEELIKLIRKKDILLFLPEQVIDEFTRNRESTLKKAIDKLQEFSSKPESPVICHEFDQMKKVQKLASEIEKELSSLIKELDRQIRTSSLHADKLISELFGLAMRIDLPRGILDSARMRHDRGNPPGKTGSYGDAINWECLLAVCPNKEVSLFCWERQRLQIRY